MMRQWLPLGVLVFLASCTSVRDRPSNADAHPISDADTAISRARTLFREMDADLGIQTPEPLSATRDGDVWTVKSPTRCGPTDTFLKVCEGNVLKLSAKDGTVLYVRHEGSAARH
jgi:hypothetical protein